MKPMATRGLPAISIEQRAAIAQARMMYKKRIKRLMEYAIGAIATLVLSGLIAYVLWGFFTEPDPFYGKGPQVKVDVRP